MTNPTPGPLEVLTEMVNGLPPRLAREGFEPSHRNEKAQEALAQVQALVEAVRDILHDYPDFRVGPTPLRQIAQPFQGDTETERGAQHG